MWKWSVRKRDCVRAGQTCSVSKVECEAALKYCQIFVREIKLYYSSFVSLTPSHTNTLPLKTHSLEWSPCGADEPPERWPENWIGLKLLFRSFVSRKPHVTTNGSQSRGFKIWVSSAWLDIWVRYMIYSQGVVSVEESGADISLLRCSKLCFLTRQERQGKTWQMTVLWEVGWLLKVSSEHLFAHILAPTADNCKDIYEPFHNDGPYILLEGK